jgi:cell division protein FtsB
MPNAADIIEIDKRIAAIRDNIRELVEEAAAFTGAADDSLIADRIAVQEAKLANLQRERDALEKDG